MATLHIDRKACVGSGLCAAMHPGLFRLTDEGLGTPAQRELTKADDIDSARDVAGCCPGEAVAVLDTP
ncbi:ferredoxin [Streptomyces sp. ISL-112]|uniref:ferredoxin n=1 Tax=unclassified Streptomyces TaxID=2593676 RepID=UPI001BEC6A08|nr:MULTISPECIES: ferredoxin [unclassified Streptomyces]MBT2426307.1 ferredoxin [Streptomyces sp. ISL-112]MBT2465839.1 ferredoxin [Streptomyces sp. ISL-63]